MNISREKAEASGPFASLLSVKEKLRKATCQRGNLFLPTQRREGVAILRQRALCRMQSLMVPGKRFVITWCKSYDYSTRMWEGSVVSVEPDGFRWVKFDAVVDRFFHFPPKDPRILVSGGRVASLDTKRIRKRYRKRKCCSRRGVREQRPNIYAMNEDFVFGSLNVDTLKIKSTEVNALRRSLRLHQVVNCMKSYGISIFALQETRLRFANNDSIVHQKLYIGRGWIHIYLMSATAGYNGMAFLSTKPLKVEQISHRIMEAVVRIGNSKVNIFNVYSPIATAKKEKQDDFDKSLLDAWHESSAPMKVICGDMNAPLQTAGGRKCYSKRAKDLRKFLQSLGAKSSHETCTSKRK